MTKNVRYTKHAIRRKLERNISDDEISKTINEPDYSLSSTGGTITAVKRMPEREIHVVYKKENKHINIITVY